jgi:transcriptional regulator with XRE-family HTH domain
MKNQQSPKKRKFKQTKQLVKLALNDGWTQKSIARSCRTQQSIVSAWASGEKLATESQLAQLLEQYGNQLRRRNFQIYYHSDSEYKFSFYRVEGKIIFSYTFVKEEEEHKRIKRIPIEKIIIHEQGKGVFRIVHQYRPFFNFENQQNDFLECSQESGYWFSVIKERMEISQVLQEIEIILEKKGKDKNWRNEQYTLPFLIRKAMLENGYHIEGIVDYPSIW